MPQQIVQWVKSHLVLVACGVVSVAAIVLIVLGMLATDVQQALAADAGLISSLRSLSAVNERVITAAEQQAAENARRVEELKQRFSELGQHVPLTADVFPQLNPARQDAPFQFKTDFGRAQREMLSLLNAGDAPSVQEIQEEQEYLNAKRAREEGIAALGAGQGRPGPGATPSASGKELAQPGVGGLSGVDAAARAGMTPEQKAAELADVRASLRRARNIYCYAALYNLDQRPAVTNEARPKLDEMWYAQMALWIQQDVIGALAGLNRDAANGLKAREVEPWVGNLPVKHVKKFSVGGYLPMAGGAGEGRSTGRLDPGGGLGAAVDSNEPGFTGRATTESVDVIHFSLQLVIDARMLPAVIDAICKAGFYTPLLVNYEVVPPNTEFVYYIYGSAPVIQVDLVYEGCFLRNKYDKVMPEEVKTAIREGRAKGTVGVSGSDSARPGSPFGAEPPGFRNR